MYYELFESESIMGEEWIIAISAALVIAVIIALVIAKRSGLFAGKLLTIDSIVGHRCIVTETIDNFAGCGQVKVGGQLWSARGFYDDDVYEVGTSLRIVAIEGVKAVCKKD